MTFMDKDPDVDYIRDEAEQELGSPANVSRGMCPQCGYSLAVHDQRDPLSTAPWGCPTSESVAAGRWGG